MSVTLDRLQTKLNLPTSNQNLNAWYFYVHCAKNTYTQQLKSAASDTKCVLPRFPSVTSAHAHLFHRKFPDEVNEAEFCTVTLRTLQWYSTHLPHILSLKQMTLTEVSGLLLTHYREAQSQWFKIQPNGLQIIFVQQHHHSVSWERVLQETNKQAKIISRTLRPTDLTLRNIC